MTMVNKVSIQHLGQTGLKIDLGSLTVLVDPYLSNSVEELEAPDLVRQVPIPYQPHELTNIDWVLITHEHMDHCDPHTVPVLAKVSPSSQFVGPRSVREQLLKWGIQNSRIHTIPINNIELGDGLYVRCVAAAHPTICHDEYGLPQSVGYMFSYNDRVLYVAGDTSVCDEMIEILKALPPIDVALLPVNEDNFFRRRRGIVGNMSVREAFELAREVKIKEVIPVHWDMFACNSTSQGEIMGVYNSIDWPFELGSVASIKL